MRLGLYRFVMIGVSDEQPPRGRLLKPRQKSEKSRQNRRAGKLGSGSAGTIRRPRVTARYGPPGSGEAAGRSRSWSGLGGGPIIRGWASDDASAPIPAVRAATIGRLKSTDTRHRRERRLQSRLAVQQPLHELRPLRLVRCHDQVGTMPGREVFADRKLFRRSHRRPRAGAWSSRSWQSSASSVPGCRHFTEATGEPIATTQHTQCHNATTCCASVATRADRGIPGQHSGRHRRRSPGERADGFSGPRTPAQNHPVAQVGTSRTSRGQINTLRPRCSSVIRAPIGPYYTGERPPRRRQPGGSSAAG